MSFTHPLAHDSLKKTTSHQTIANPKNKIWDILFLSPQKLVSSNGCFQESSTLIGFSIINHPFLGTLIFGNTQNLGHLGFLFQINQPKRRPKTTPNGGCTTHLQGSGRSLTTFLKLRSCTSGNTWNACVRQA